MNKYIFGVILSAAFLLPFSAFAATITPGVQAHGGTVTDYTGSINGCNSGCAGFNSASVGIDLQVNGVTVNSISSSWGGLGGGAGPHQMTQTGISQAFNQGDDVELIYNGDNRGNLGAYTMTGTIVDPCAAGRLTADTLGCSIDSANMWYYFYFQVLLIHYWPFVVGAGLLLGVWFFGRRILKSYI